MGVIFKRGPVWYLDYSRHGERIKESSLSVNRAVAEQMLFDRMVEAGLGSEEIQRRLRLRRAAKQPEAEMLRSVLGYFQAKGEFAEGRVACASGIVDLVTSDSIFELKVILDTHKAMTAVGQLMLYQKALRDDSLWGPNERDIAIIYGDLRLNSQQIGWLQELKIMLVPADRYGWVRPTVPIRARLTQRDEAICV